MTASQILDMTQINNTAVTSENGTSSCADESCNFENVFDNITKNYQENENNNQIKDTTQNKNVESSNDTATIDNKTIDKQPIENTKEISTDDTNQQSEQSLETTEDPITNIQKSKTITLKNLDESSENIKETTNMQSSETTILETTEQKITTENSLDLLTKEFLNEFSNSTQKNTQQNPLNTQQEIINNQSISKEIVTNKAGDNALIQQTKQEEIAKPLVKVAENITQDIEAKISNNDDLKQNVKDILDKTTLNQDKLDKLNVKITNVETLKQTDNNSNPNTNNNSNFNNLLNQQNTQEQTIKLEIANKTDSHNINFNSVSDSLIHQNTTKSIETSHTPQLQTSAQTPKDINQSDIISQINKQITKGFQNEETTKVNIILKPESLGKINIELINSKDGLTAKMTTDNAQVKELLDKNIDGLKSTLSNHGINVNNVNVKVSETQKQDNMFSFDSNLDQENQQSQENSENSQTVHQNRISFDEDIDSDIEETEEISSSETQSNKEAQSTNYNSERIDYKV